MEPAVLIDIGSTFTKVTAVDWRTGQLLATSQAPTTASTDVMLGLDAALRQLGIDTKRHLPRQMRACSSAAGGLRMVAVGLVPDLTVKAANQAALGAGAKVLATFGYKLSSSEVQEIVDLNPDMVLLAGGTDGGDEQVLLHNARMLAACPLRAPLVVAGNKVISADAAAILVVADKPVRLTENVMPTLNRLNVEPVRQAIRELFMERIIEGKGLRRIADLVSSSIVPTPMAVMTAAELLAAGADEQPGLGELMVLDVGGATTDVHSIARGAPTRSGMIQRGLPEPYAKRTVEGDLGVRWNAINIVERLPEMAGGGDPDVRDRAARLTKAVDFIPDDATSAQFDVQLAHDAVILAVGRHVGQLETIYTPDGPMAILHGKDLSDLQVVIGTGGVLRYGLDAGRVMAGALYDQAEPSVLRPRNPKLYVDADYILASAGLLAEVNPGAAVRLMLSSLQLCGHGSLSTNQG